LRVKKQGKHLAEGNGSRGKGFHAANELHSTFTLEGWVRAIGNLGGGGWIDRGVQGGHWGMSAPPTVWKRMVSLDNEKKSTRWGKGKKMISN